MSKKVFLICISIFCCLFLSCKNGKTSSATPGPVTTPFTTETIKGYTYINPVDLNVMDYSETIHSTFDIPKNQKITFIDYNGNEFLTLETKVKGKKKQINCNINEMKFPADMAARLVPLALENNNTWAYNIVNNVHDKLPAAEINLIISTLMNENQNQWLTHYIPGSMVHKRIANLCHHLLQKYDGKNMQAETTPYNLLAEKACYSLCEELNLETYANCSDKYNKTLLTAAITSENLDVVRYLYDKKRIHNIPDNNGKTPVDYAKETNNEEIQKLLEILNYTPEELLEMYKAVAEEIQYSENFKTIGINAFDIPYSIYNLVQTNNLTIKVNTRDEYFTEFAIQQNIALDEENDQNNSDENTDEEKKKIINFAFVYSSDENGMPDFLSRLKLRNSPSTSAKEISALDYGTKVTIIEHTEEPDVIGNISDYWYKVSDGKKEGWCFGGFLAVPVLKSDACKNDNNTKWLIQDKLDGYGSYTACEESVIYGIDNQIFEVKPLDKIEIVNCFEYPVPDEKVDIRKSFVSYCSGKKEIKNYYHSIYPFYIVRDSKNNTGIMSGKGLTKIESSSTNDYTYNYVLKTDLHYGYHFYCDVYESRSGSNDLKKLTFVKQQNGNMITEEYDLGYCYESTIKDMRNGPHLTDLYDLSKIHSNLKSKGRVAFFNCENYDDWGEQTTHTAFTIDEHGFATYGHTWYSRPYRRNNGYEYLSDVYSYTDEYNRLKVVKYDATSSLDDSSERNEHCYETTYLYNGPDFEEKESKETNEFPRK